MLTDQQCLVINQWLDAKAMADLAKDREHRLNLLVKEIVLEHGKPADQENEYSARVLTTPPRVEACRQLVVTVRVTEQVNLDEATRLLKAKGRLNRYVEPVITIFDEEAFLELLGAKLVPSVFSVDWELTEEGLDRAIEAGEFSESNIATICEPKLTPALKAVR
jgi:hypothetical protein